MLDLFDIAKPQNCDIQTFYGTAFSAVSSTLPRQTMSWTKPRGVSHVYMMLIGGGGAGNGSTGGGSGAVTVWYGAAQNVPDNLILYVPRIGQTIHTYIWPTSLQNSFTTSNYLLVANTASNITGGTTMTANQFAASGFFQSVAGQNGVISGSTASSTTFLSGANGATGTTVGNYGYSVTDQAGYFQLQPIIVGVGGAGVATSPPADGSIGCGGGRSSNGGPGFALIASW